MQPESPVWAEEGTTDGHLTSLCMGDRVCFLDHCVCPMRPTHRALLSPGSPGKRGGVKNGLRTFKNRYNLQTFQHINMMCLHSDEGQETILALGAKNNLLL